MNVALMLAFLGRKLLMADRMIRQGSVDVSALRGMEFSGKVLGLIGIGDISRRTAKICRDGFGMRVIGWSRHLGADGVAEPGIEIRKSMDEVFEEADVIMPGLDLTEETKGLIGKNSLRR